LIISTTETSLCEFLLYHSNTDFLYHANKNTMALDTLLSSLMLQLGLASLGLAAPVSPTSHDNSWQYGTSGGLLGLVILILDIIVFGTPPRGLLNAPC
jgi:hypothetical protein